MVFWWPAPARNHRHLISIQNTLSTEKISGILGLLRWEQVKKNQILYLFFIIPTHTHTHTLEVKLKLRYRILWELASLVLVIISGLLLSHLQYQPSQWTYQGFPWQSQTQILVTSQKQNCERFDVWNTLYYIRDLKKIFSWLYLVDKRE